MNALATLVLCWSGDSRWPPDGERIYDARDYALAFEHEMKSFAALAAISARREAAPVTEGDEHAHSE
jgi:hypothetical protein